MTTHSTVRGKYACHPYLPYALAPNYERKGHNSLGFRGREFNVEKSDDVTRIVCIGGSTTYSGRVGPDQTYPAQLEKLLRDDGVRCEVINAGVPGWTSVENMINLQLRVLPLKPDIVVVYQGRNDAFPQAYNDFRPDYSHFRRPDYSFPDSNYLHKPLFRVSNLLLILCTYKGNRLGWSSSEENPPYGGITVQNSPSREQLVEHLSDTSRITTYERMVNDMIAACHREGVKIIFGTMAFNSKRLVTGLLPTVPRATRTPAVNDALQQQIEENNKIVRESCALHDVPVVETALLREREELFIDDCHCKAAGHALRAKLVFEVIKQERLIDN